MQNHKVVSREEWLEARKQFLAREKEFTRLRDQLSKERRALPWERVAKNYIFDTPAGKETLGDLFQGRSQLLVYHFMFDPDWEAGCPHCSFWADNFNRIPVHLEHRDVTMVAISRAPLSKLEAYRKRMGWSFRWISSFGSDFNYDYYVSFTEEELAQERAFHNYAPRGRLGKETAGVSVFHKDADGAVFHTYSCYSRGVDMLNGAYHYLDLVPKGRDEAGHSNPQFWVRRHDEYKD
jgi:predicted dithiol-disulfide oxidoreductase (DUF899 family)